MQISIAKWGNSLAIRIPRYLLEGTSLKEGSAVSIEVQDGTLVIKPTKKKFKLSDLLANHKPQHNHDETDWGAKQGAEDW